MVRSKKIDALRGFAIFLVILGHSIILFPINLHNVRWCGVLFYVIAAFHLPMFYAISGYCYKKKPYKLYIRQKARRLLLPYAIFSILSLLLKTLLPGAINGNVSIKKEILADLLYGGSYSFLYILFILFLVFPLVEKAIEKWNVLPVILIALLSACSKMMVGFHHLFAIDNVMYYLLFFTVGYIIRRYDDKKINNIVNSVSSKVMITVCMLIVTLLLFVNYSLEFRLLEILIAFIGMILFAIIFDKLELLQTLFSDVGLYTLQLYLLNGYLLVVSRTVICNIMHVTNPVIIILFNMFVDFGLSYILIKYVLARIKPIKFLMGM